MSQELEKFLEERSKIPIPSGDVKWVRLLASELALGVHRNLWNPMSIAGQFVGGARAMHPNSQAYFQRRWANYDMDHLVEVLLGHEYLNYKENDDSIPQLTTKAYELIDEDSPYSIFISYRRLDSSALALLVLARLKEHSLVPFVDMALEVGGNWHADLEERIRACDYFIILLGRKTLTSDMTVKEICWAVDSKRTIIPIWHNYFGRTENFDLTTTVHECAAEWEDEFILGKEDLVKGVIQQTNAIRVTDESASGYNSAIVELLNRFGVTP